MHHAGLLPIMKEVVEMLACQGYVKVSYLGYVYLNVSRYILYLCLLTAGEDTGLPG